MSPSNNVTTPERSRRRLDDVYTLGCDLVDETGWRSRFWFRNEEDRSGFAAIFNALHALYGHTTIAEIAQ